MEPYGRTGFTYRYDYGNAKEHRQGDFESNLIYLGKIFASQSDVIKLDPSVCKYETGDLSPTTGREVGQPQLLRVARLHLQALAQTLSQFLDHFLSVDVSFYLFRPTDALSMTKQGPVMLIRVMLWVERVRAGWRASIEYKLTPSFH